MAHLRLHGICLIVLIVGLVVFTTVSGQRPLPRTRSQFGITADAATQKLLATVRALIGSDARIRAVAGFTLTSVDHHPSLRLRFPDQFRVDFAGSVVHVVDGTHYWLLQRPRGRAEVKVPDPGDGRRERTIRQFAATSLNFLLRAPDGAPVHAYPRGRVAVKTLSGEAIRFQFANGTVVHDLILDPATSRPLGTAVADKTTAGEAYTAVLRFLQFRTVAGLTIPARVHEEWVPVSAPVRPWPGDSTHDVGTVVFDPPPSARDFKDPLPR